MITGKRVPLKDTAALANTHGNSRADAPWTALAVPTFLLMACARQAPPQTVSIVYKPIMPYCRTTVHIGQYNLLQAWSADMLQWATSVRECLVEAMQGQ